MSSDNGRSRAEQIRKAAADSEAARRAEVLRLPSRATSLGPALAGAAALVKAAEADAAAISEELDVPDARHRPHQASAPPTRHQAS